EGAGVVLRFARRSAGRGASLKERRRLTAVRPQPKSARLWPSWARLAAFEARFPALIPLISNLPASLDTRIAGISTREPRFQAISAAVGSSPRETARRVAPLAASRRRLGRLRRTRSRRPAARGGRYGSRRE